MVQFYLSNNYKEGQMTVFKIDFSGECISTTNLLLQFYLNDTTKKHSTYSLSKNSNWPICSLFK